MYRWIIDNIYLKPQTSQIDFFNRWSVTDFVFLAFSILVKVEVEAYLLTAIVVLNLEHFFLEWILFS